MDEEHAYSCLFQFIKYFIRDYVWLTFDEGFIPALKHMMKLVKEADEEVYDMISFIDIPTFAVSWVITIFSHTLGYVKSAWLLDFVISSHPLSILYVVAQYIVTFKE